MIEAILANTVGGILSEVLGTVLKQPMKRVFDEYNMQRALTAAVKRAEERFARDYHNTDSELTAVLIAQTRFADIPSVHLALKEMLTHPFHDPRYSTGDRLEYCTDEFRVWCGIGLASAWEWS